MKNTELTLARMTMTINGNKMATSMRRRLAKIQRQVISETTAEIQESWRQLTDNDKGKMPHQDKMMNTEEKYLSLFLAELSSKINIVSFNIFGKLQSDVSSFHFL